MASAVVRFAVPIDDAHESSRSRAADDDRGIPRSNIVALPPPSYEEVVSDPAVAAASVAVPIPAELRAVYSAIAPASATSSSSSSPSSAATPPPPSYEALYGRVSQTGNKIAPQVYGYMQSCKCACFPAGTIATLVYIVPITMIVIGSVYVRDCPQGVFIPGWMIIAGFIWLIKPLLFFTTLVRRTAEEQRLERHRQRHTRNMVHAFMFGWFLIGSYFVFRIWPPNYDAQLGPHCARLLYEFAFVLLATVYGALLLMLGTAVLIVLLSVCLMACSGVDGGIDGGATGGHRAAGPGACVV